MITGAPDANVFYPGDNAGETCARKTAQFEPVRGLERASHMTQSRWAAHEEPNEIREKIMDSFSERKNPAPPPQSHFLFEGCVKIVSAYVAHNAISAASLPKLIKDIHGALQALRSSAPVAARSNLVPAVDLKKSVTNDYIVCLEDGKRFKTLKRHLRVHYGMTPEEYRQKWGLAPNYPMVAQNYANRRSELAKLSGLGANGNRKETVR
ncbi:transcriptional regulator, MucR family [Rhizobium lusitanum]|jgi:predicted transcriptional regulator|uniref:Transcriptional regulator, MucR family n=2 Tax=Rhizobium/Agrobacterium group TaxID=227290 RepID=A0A1C3XIQ3_9HYPH|nr:transcriptional regulator, MucR family [Rhizobium lusitanum]